MAIALISHDQSSSLSLLSSSDDTCRGRAANEPAIADANELLGALTIACEDTVALLLQDSAGDTNAGAGAGAGAGARTGAGAGADAGDGARTGTGADAGAGAGAGAGASADICLPVFGSNLGWSCSLCFA